MRWSIDTDPLVMLHAMPLQVNKLVANPAALPVKTSCVEKETLGSC